MKGKSYAIPVGMVLKNTIVANAEQNWKKKEHIEL